MTIGQFLGKGKSILERLEVSATLFMSSVETCFYRKLRSGILEWLEVSGNSGVRVARDNLDYEVKFHTPEELLRDSVSELLDPIT